MMHRQGAARFAPCDSGMATPKASRFGGEGGIVESMQTGTPCLYLHGTPLLALVVHCIIFMNGFMLKHLAQPLPIPFCVPSTHTTYTQVVSSQGWYTRNKCYSHCRNTCKASFPKDTRRKIEKHFNNQITLYGISTNLKFQFVAALMTT